MLLKTVLKPARKLLQKRSVIVIAGLLVSVLLPLVFLWIPTVLQSLDAIAYDTLLTSTDRPEASSVPVIVDVDEKSLDRYGQWPWPRYRIGLLLEKIRRLGAAAVAADMVFSEPDQTSPGRIQNDLLNDLGIKIEFVGLPESLMDNDQILANILANGPFILAYNFLFEPAPGNGDGLHPLNVAVARAPHSLSPERYLYTAAAVNQTIPVIQNAAGGSGFFNALPDADGVIRRTPLLIRYEDRYYPSLALAAVTRALGIQQAVMKLTYGGIDLRVGPRIIPLDRDGSLLINYRGPKKTYSYVSAADVLADRLDAGVFENRIVFVGTSTAGLKDIRSTPFDKLIPGVEINASVVDDILTGEFLKRPAWSHHMEVGIGLAAGILSTLLLAWASPTLGIGVLACGVVLLWGGSAFLMARTGLFVSPLVPLCVLGLNFSILSMLKFWLESSEKEFIHSTFSRYVSKAVANQLVRSRDVVSLTGDDKEVSILFCDIRGFTSISETMSSKDVSSLLREYFTPMTRLIIASEGTLDKFIGDAVMAFWNAPIDVRDHPVKAVSAAMGMLTELRLLNERFRQTYGFEIAIGIGVNTGQVRVGNMGSEDLFDYTVIGDAVNLAARMESLTKAYGVSLLVSDQVRAACMESADSNGWFFQEIDRVRVRGKEETATLFTVLTAGEHADRSGEIELFQEGLDHYRIRSFDRAAQVFGRLVETSPAVLYSVYLKRCQELMEAPPGDDWQGVFSHTSK